ncbi:MAG: outer membrane lipoprotein carrier protein LolA, partial [Alphaproteobacteria bacterium]|nr:outer membrane lipoprotein carrier protein LolA [Alphaproteobacteria bacterium]
SVIILGNSKSRIHLHRNRGLLAAMLLVIGLGLTGQAQAQTVGVDPNASINRPEPQSMGAVEQKILLAEIENYFDNVDTLKARFNQINMDGTVYQGDVMMDRPGKMRIDYDAPLPFKIIADGTFYIFVDEELKEASHIPLGLTPASILLRKPMKLGDELTVLDAERDNGILRITVAQKDSPEAGTLTFAFSEDPLSLVQWTVVDQQGTITRVVLDNVQTGIELDNDQFYFVNPWLGKREK